jgi:TolB-like protein
MAARHAVKRESDVVHPTDEEVWACLPLLFGRPEFNASERNRRFLSYVVEETLGGRADRIKAYTIALAAFHRSEDFDPMIDPIVRIEASRLRRSLEHYYLTAGRADRIRIGIPKGSYVPTFAYNDAVAWEPEAAAADPMPMVLQPPMAARRRSWAMLAPVLAALIILAAGMAAYWPWSASHEEAAGASAHALSITVVPFENTSGDPGRAFVARGLTYEVILRLTQLDDVTVFNSNGGLGDGGETRAAARSNYALFGSVQSETTRIRVTAILADSRTGQFLHSWYFEGDLETLDYPDIQSEFASQIVDAVRRLCATAIAPGEGGLEDPAAGAAPYDCRHLGYVAAN